MICGVIAMHLLSKTLFIFENTLYILRGASILMAVLGYGGAAAISKTSHFI